MKSDAPQSGDRLSGAVESTIAFRTEDGDCLASPNSGCPVILDTERVTGGRRGQTFTLRILAVTERQSFSRPRHAAILSDAKDAAGVARAHLECGYTQQEIADHLGVHYSTISRRVHAVDGRRRRNTKREDGT